MGVLTIFRFLFTAVSTAIVLLTVFITQVQANNACATVLLVDASAITVEHVSDQGEVVLADGRTIQLPGVIFPNKTLAAHELRKILQNKNLVMSHSRPKPDRWMRYNEHIAISDDTKIDLAIESLVKQGLALLFPDSLMPAGRRKAAASADCFKYLEGLETSARLMQHGIWNVTEGFPLDAIDTLKLQHFEGQFVIVTGKIISVGERKNMTFLNFGTNWREDFSVIIPRKNWNKMVEEGMTKQVLVGRTILVRGYLQMRESALRQDNPEVSRAPYIRLLDKRNFSVTDTD